ncbi:LOW QUALITY PROTEIN: hypothetical protein PoB_003785000 [Plakobranchus ocellatus]|uniref:Uncharacterized protein n=1 Tax=Plakobranchus ocellatus TaxID=259542 RepID=A0AAV4AVN1_9GAST|nr:LOW QUALITY PROTEIN: hypothetical protein PoB_003785000 [Plakobranchus ocellatus]
MSQTRLTQGFGVNRTSKSALGLPRNVGSSSGRGVSRDVGSLSGRWVRAVPSSSGTGPPQVVFSDWLTVASQASLSDNWHTSAQRPLRSGTRSPRGRSHIRLRFLSVSPPCHDRDTLREKAKSTAKILRAL